MIVGMRKYPIRTIIAFNPLTKNLCISKSGNSAEPNDFFTVSMLIPEFIIVTAKYINKIINRPINNNP